MIAQLLESRHRLPRVVKCTQAAKIAGARVADVYFLLDELIDYASRQEKRNSIHNFDWDWFEANYDYEPEYVDAILRALEKIDVISFDGHIFSSSITDKTHDADRAYRDRAWEEERKREEISRRFEEISERPAEPKIPWNKLRIQVFERDAYTCAYCGTVTEHPHCDHVVPLARGGETVLENLVTACPSCNCSKGGKTLEEWRGN